MTALASLLFPEPTLQRSPAAVLRWWEARRPLYNAVVGATGIFTLSLFGAVAGGDMLADRMVWATVVAYAVMANICYSAGAPIELLVQRWLRRDTYGLGPALFRYGLLYSVGLTLFPVALGATAILAKLLAHLLR